MSRFSNQFIQLNSAMKLSYRLALLLLATIASLSMSAQNQNIEFRSKMSFPGQTIANVCGYADNGREYALLGASLGLIIVDVTDPEMPVQITQVPGPNNLWKEIKTYSHYTYTTSEGGFGINIVDLSKLPDANLDFHSYLGDSTVAGAVTTIHALHIDVTKGFLYAYGTSIFQGGALVFDLKQDPYNPKYVGKFDQFGYIHDGYVDNDTLFASHIYSGLFSVVDMTDKANPKVLATQQTPNSFTHNTWLSDDHKVVFTTDETPNSFLTAYDISDLDDIKLLDKVQSNPGSNSAVHNTHVRGNYAITSWYHDGVTIVDATLPGNLVQVGNYDTYPQAGGPGFDGCWGVYPFLPSGNLIVGNVEPGEMYVLAPTYVRAAYLAGKVTDSQTGNPISGAKIEIVGNPSAEKFSNNVGNYSIGQMQAGAIEVKVTKLGYIPQTVPVNILSAVTTTLDFALLESPSYTISGNVRRASNGNPVPNAEVAISSPDLSFSIIADGNGQFSIPGVFAGEYDVIAGLWGYQYGVLANQNISGNQQVTIELTEGYQDDFVFDYGWTASGTSLTGIWERGIPLGIDVGVLLAPDMDVSNDLGNQCYVTGNSSSEVAVDDVESGTSILLSPGMDLSGYLNPHISAQFWCTSFTQNQQSLDSIKMYISNGTEEKLVLAVKGDQLNWRNLSFDVTDFVSLSSDMHLRVACYDPPNSPLFDSYEAAFDNFKVTDQALATNEPINFVQLSALPNPFSGSTLIDYEGAENGSRLRVYDLLGNLLETQILAGNSGQVLVGKDYKNGIYFVRLEQQNASVKTVKIMKIN